MDSIQGSNLFIIVIVAFVLSVLITDDESIATTSTVNILESNLFAEQATSDCNNILDSSAVCEDLAD